MAFKQHNINNQIKIKLKDEGIKIMEKRYEELGLKYEHKPDKDGYTTFQTHYFMRIFGPYMILGCDIPFDTVILVDVKENKNVR